MTIKTYAINLHKQIFHPTQWLFNPFTIVMVTVIIASNIWHPAIYILFGLLLLMAATFAVEWHKAPR